MAGLIAYKAALAALLVATASLGGSTYYSQQQMTSLNNKVSNLTGQLNNSTSQVSNLDSQISSLNDQITQLKSLNLQTQSQNSQLSTQLSQLQTEISHLQAQIQNLTKVQVVTHTTLISSGTISIPEGGTASTIQYVPFSVSSNTATAYINLTFTTASYGLGGQNVMAALLNQTQYHLFTCCDTTNANNYTLLPTTWSSPWSDSYNAQVSIPNSGNWYLAFFDTPGYAYGGNMAETITLTTQNSQ